MAETFAVLVAVERLAPIFSLESPPKEAPPFPEVSSVLSMVLLSLAVWDSFFTLFLSNKFRNAWALFFVREPVFP